MKSVISVSFLIGIVIILLKHSTIDMMNPKSRKPPARMTTHRIVN